MPMVAMTVMIIAINYGHSALLSSNVPLSQRSDVEDVIPALEEPRGQGDFFYAPTTLCIHPCMGRRVEGHQEKLPRPVTRADIAGWAGGSQAQRSPTAPDRGHSICKGPERRQQGIWVSFQGSCETEGVFWKQGLPVGVAG